MNAPRRAGRVRGRVLLVLIVLLGLVGVAGCTGGAPVTRSSTTPVVPSSTPVRPEGDSGELASAKAAAKIEDCPTTTADTPVEGGLPGLTLDCLGGGRPVQLAGLRGRPMVINIWAQWCGPCREEAPYLAEVSQQTRGAVTFLGVDYLDPAPAQAIDFARRSGWRYPQVVDPEAALQVPLRLPSGIPITVFVRADGTVAFIHPTPLASSDQLRELITTHLGVPL